MMWLGSRFTDFDYRKDFIKTYLKEANLPFDQSSVEDMMLDCEINTIVAFQVYCQIFTMLRYHCCEE